MADSQDKSIAGGMSIPSWMKQKIGDRYDLDDAAFSPPSQDDSFFYIRYPKTTKRTPSESNYYRINKYLESQTSASSSKCEREMAAETSRNLRSLAPDEPFTTSKFVKNSKAELEFDPDQPPPNLSYRRGSKSLPASPLTSPKFERKNLTTSQNRYFTAAFPPPKVDTNSVGYTGWLLAGLLGQREQTPSEGLVAINEGESSSALAVPNDTEKQNSNLKKSVSVSVMDNSNESSINQVQNKNKAAKAIKPKPSELREMNFWSPTSM